MNWLYEMSYEELIDYIKVLLIDIEDLTEQLKLSQKKMSDKITKDYEDNRDMIANIFKEIVHYDAK